MAAQRSTRHFNAYIDEAGDEGFTRLGWRRRGVEEASSEWLILGAALILEPRTCPVCGTLFIPATANQIYCPPTDADRARRNSQPRSRCAKRADNIRYRAGYRPRRAYV